MADKTLRQRDAGLDLLRCVCMSGVVLLHSIQTVVFACGNAPAIYWETHLAVFAALRWPVLIFFLLSGVLFPSTFTIRDIPAYYRRRAWKILPPFLAWSVIFCFIRGTSNVTWETNWDTVAAVLSQVPHKMSYYHLWFMYDFILIILAAPFIIILKNNFRIFDSRAFLLLSGVLLFASQAFVDLGHVGRIPVYVFYFYLGTFMHSFEGKYRYLLLALGVAGFGYNFLSARDIVAATGNCDLVTSTMRYSFIQQLPMVLAAYFIARDVRITRTAFSNAATKIALCGFGIYLSHPLFIWLFRFDKLESYLRLPPLVFGLFVFLVCSLASLALAWLLRTNRHTRWLSP
ncbi:acyltransferase [Desulfovibrio sp. Fe33]|uniref:acyltransferase n=1 Tax=Desulfovibrio sp. Fe33 TaxID=3020842 RepID=UPI00234D1832|nr:acyltransferase [Desulfovibrio sp. Fe33]